MRVHRGNVKVWFVAQSVFLTDHHPHHQVKNCEFAMMHVRNTVLSFEPEWAANSTVW